MKFHSNTQTDFLMFYGLIQNPERLKSKGKSNTQNAQIGCVDYYYQIVIEPRHIKGQINEATLFQRWVATGGTFLMPRERLKIAQSIMNKHGIITITRDCKVIVVL